MEQRHDLASKDARIGRSRRPRTLREVPADVERAIERWEESLELLEKRRGREKDWVAKVNGQAILHLGQGFPSLKRTGLWTEALGHFRPFKRALLNRILKGEVDPKLGHGFIFGLLFRLGNPAQDSLVSGLARRDYKGLGPVHLTTTTFSTSVCVTHTSKGSSEDLRRHEEAAVAKYVLLVAYREWRESKGVKGRPWVTLADLLSDYGQWKAERMGTNVPGDLETMMRRVWNRKGILDGAHRYIESFADGLPPDEFLFKELRRNPQK